MRNAILIGERVYLRPLETSDTRAASEMDHLEDSAEMDGAGRMPVSPLEYAVEYLGKSKSPPDWFPLAICLRDTDEYIGEVSIGGLDWLNRTGETASYLRPDGPYRGHGYGTEAKLLLLEYCFEWLDLHVIQSRVSEKNVRSAAALRKQGYKLAGRLKWCFTKDGVYYDTLLFDITREEWHAVRAGAPARSVHRRSTL
jgi:RimJ/RimL family protein N-acetyltransferase